MWTSSKSNNMGHPTSTLLLTLIPTLLFSIFVYRVRGEEQPYLEIIPATPNGIHRVALGEPSVFTCSGKVDRPERLTEMRWWYPDNKPIEPTPQNSEGYEEEARIEILPGDQPGQSTLFFSTVQNEDLGQYKCSAMYANNQPLTTSFKLSAYVPITFEDAPTNQHAVKNSDYKVKCRVRADPSPQVDWKFDHKTINSSDHYVLTSDGVLIKNVSEADEGVFTCRVRVVSLGKVEERHIQLEVQEKPKIVAQQPPVEGVEAGDVILQCSALGKPPPEYQWVNHRGQDLSELERFVVDKYKGILRIDGLRREDGGIYRCTAKNTAGIDTMTARLTVVTKPVIEEFKNVTSQVDGSAVLTCRASGEPAPDIFFHKDSKTEPFTHGLQRDTRIFTDQRKEGSVTVANIKIDNILRTDDGLYNCIARNSKIQTERLGHLTVEYPPSFANTPVKEAWSWDGRPVNITCLAEAIPNATIAWYFRSNPEILVVENPPEIQIFGTQSQSSLQVYPINRERYGFYVCVATNRLGTASHQIQLKEARKPGLILQVITHEKTATSVSFKIVGPVDDGGLPITRFVAQYKEGQSYNWNDAKTMQWPVDQQLFIVENLEPLRQYHFRFAAENAVGVGDFAQERFELMPKRSFPEPPKVLAETYQGYAINPYPDRYDLRWQVPQDNGERIDYFEISYVPVRNVSINEWSSYGSRLVEQKPLGEPRHMLRNLSPGTFYKIEIRAHNSIGNSPPSTLIMKTALPHTGHLGGNTVGYEVAENLSDASFKMPILIAIVLAILLLLLCFLDVACCKMNQTGIMWTLSHKACGKKSDNNTTKSAICEKQPLNESIMDVRDSLRPGDPKNIHSIPHGKISNSNGTKSEHPTVSAV